MCGWSVLIWQDSPFPVTLLMCQWVSPSLFQQLSSAMPAQALHSGCRGCTWEGHRGWGLHMSDCPPQAGAWAETPLDFPVAGVQGVKKLNLLVGFWLGLRNAFAPLLFHTPFLEGSSLGFVIYLTFLQNFIKVEWIWVAARSAFQHVYLQFVCQIIFQAFHSFVPCNLFFNELAWGMWLSHI